MRRSRSIALEIVRTKRNSAQNQSRTQISSLVSSASAFYYDKEKKKNSNFDLKKSGSVKKYRNMFSTAALVKKGNDHGKKIPVLVFSNEKLMDTEPVKRLRKEVFKNLRVSVVLDVNGALKKEGDVDDDFDENNDDDKMAIGWWFGGEEALNEYVNMNESGKMKNRNIVWMHSASAGVEHLLKYESVRAHSSEMTNARGAFSASLGEWAIFSAMYFAKGVCAMQDAQREKTWKRFKVEMLRGKEMCVVGYGDIGREVGNRAKAMGMRVVGVRSRKQIEDRDKHVVSEMFTLGEMKLAVKNADYVTVALPHTEKTENAINKEIFDAMKTSAVLINIGRGASVDEDALCNALETNSIKSCALDVFREEPIPENSKLWNFDQSKILMSFHSADLTHDYHDLAMEVFIKNLRRFDAAQGQTETLMNKVDKTVGY